MSVSSYIRFGRNKGFKWIKDGPMLRIHLTFITLSFGLVDIEGLIEDLTQKVDDKNERINNFDNEQRAVRDRMASAEMNASELIEKENKTRLEIESLKKEVERLKNAAELVQDDLDDMEIEKDAAEAETENLTRELEKIKEDLEMANASLTDVEDEKIDLEKEKESLETTVVEYKKYLRNIWALFEIY